MVVEKTARTKIEYKVKRDRDDVLNLVHSPEETAAEFVQYAERFIGGAGLRFGVPSIDSVMIPLHPSDVLGIIARPGHGKSTLAAYLAHKTALDIAASGKNECVVYVTAEQSVEEIEALFEVGADYSVTDIAWGRVPVDTLKQQSIKRVRLPIWTIGKSVSRRRQTPRMTFENIIKAIEMMETSFETHPRPALIVLDYVQIIPIDGKATRTEQVENSIARTKELALDLACPVVMCVQARRDVDDYETKIPRAADCQHSSAIEQAADKLIGIWRPILTEHEKTLEMEINGNRESLPVTQTLLVAQLLKQRFAAAGHIFPLHFAPELVQLNALELRRAL